MSYQQFQDYLDSNGFSHFSVKDGVVPVMKSLIMRSILATRKKLDPQRRRNCFELFGYDFIIDEDFNSWLIEVNTNPCIEESSSILKKLIPRMIDDMMKLSVDAMFNDFTSPNYPNGPSGLLPTFTVPGYSDEENMWELLCNVRDKKSKKEAKLKYITSKPHIVNSKYAFQVKDRQFKIKKYLLPASTVGASAQA